MTFAAIIGAGMMTSSKLVGTHDGEGGDEGEEAMMQGARASPHRRFVCGQPPNGGKLLVDGVGGQAPFFKMNAVRTTTMRLKARVGSEAWLEKAYMEHSNGLTALKVDPTYDPLRGDPRFQTLVRQVGLAQ